MRKKKGKKLEHEKKNSIIKNIFILKFRLLFFSLNFFNSKNSKLKPEIQRRNPKEFPRNRGPLQCHHRRFTCKKKTGISRTTKTQKRAFKYHRFNLYFTKLSEMIHLFLDPVV